MTLCILCMYRKIYMCEKCECMRREMVESPTILRFPNTLWNTQSNYMLFRLRDKWISIFYRESCLVVCLCVTRKPMPFPMLMVTLNHFYFCLPFIMKYFAKNVPFFSLRFIFFHSLTQSARAFSMYAFFYSILFFAWILGKQNQDNYMVETSKLNKLFRWKTRRKKKKEK